MMAIEGEGRMCMTNYRTGLYQTPSDHIRDRTGHNQPPKLNLNLILIPVLILSLTLLTLLNPLNPNF